MRLSIQSSDHGATHDVNNISAEKSALCETEGPCLDVWRLTGRAERGFDEGFRSGCYRLHRPGLFGC